MTSRQAGQRIRIIAARRGGKRQKAARARRPAGRRSQTVRPGEQRRLLQLVACASIFVLLVAVKLLLPGRMAPVSEKLAEALARNMDVQAVFSAVGRAASGEEDRDSALENVYQAVFRPQEEQEEAAETAAAPESGLETLRDLGSQTSAAPETPPTEDQETEETPEVSTLAYILYSDQNLPENVSMEQVVLGFDYQTPLTGTVSSSFGYREHPTEGEEKFHYGLDIAADSGAAVSCFADGTVTAVGESSSYGRYCIITHDSGYRTLYAHCSRITVSSGQQVSAGEKVAEVGETGMATGPHLHFELQHGGTYLNPVYYVSQA